MDPVETECTCKKILAMYKYDPDEAHIYEDEFLQKFLTTLAKEIELLPSETDKVLSFKATTQECMQHINKLLRTKRTKWYA